MKRSIGLSFLPFLLILLVAQQMPAQPQTHLVLTHVTVIDASGAPAQRNMAVVITGDRITEIGKIGHVHVPKNAEVFDETGKFLIPGLWDMHVHWYAKKYLPLFIANGVTGIRLMWGQPIHHQWRKEIEQGTLLGPRMVIASPIVDGPNPFWPGSIGVANEEDARLVVARVKQDGADFVKVYSRLPREAYFAIADEAKKQGIPFEGHVPFSVTAEEASDAGQKSFEHLFGVLPGCSLRGDELNKAIRDDLAESIASGTRLDFELGQRFRKLSHVELDSYSTEKAAALFARFKKNGTWQCPTLTVNRSYAYIDDQAFRNDPRLKYVPIRIKSDWEPGRDPTLVGRTPEDVVFAKNEFQKGLEVTAAMQRAGVGILAGTDVLNPFCFPGFSLHDELALLVQAGLTPMEALQSATLNPARFLGKEKELGTVATGKIADLVVLDANPLEDIGNTRKIVGVVFGGRFFTRASLNEMLREVEALAARKPIGELLSKIIAEKDVESAIKRYHELKSTQPEIYNFDEIELNELGYQLLEAKKINEAIRIFELNVEAYPMSSNVYDSLGEAYMAHGDKELAIRNYKKSLDLDPRNTNAVDKLKELNH